MGSKKITRKGTAPDETASSKIDRLSHFCLDQTYGWCLDNLFKM